MTAQQLGAYQWSLDWMADIDPYSGLVVSMHRTGLWQGRYGTIKYPAGRYNLTKLSAEVQALITHNEAWQERQRATLDAKGVWTNYRLMQVWDLLGLYFCCQEPYDDYIEPVPVGYSGADNEGVRVSLKPVGPRRVALRAVSVRRPSLPGAARLPDRPPIELRGRRGLPARLVPGRGWPLRVRAGVERFE